jgi:hypothetical protein
MATAPQAHKLFQIFRAGAHIAMCGIPLDFSERDLQITAATYRPDIRPAPLVLGHPTDDQPTYGQVRGLFVKEGKLFAQAQVDDALVTLVRKGHYRNVSASFISPFASNNPTPGAYYLKHVGFLGAVPPAVRGIIPPEFAERMSTFSFFGLDCSVSFDASVEFAEGACAMPYRWALHALALDYQRVCPALSYTEAVSHAEIVIF